MTEKETGVDDGVKTGADKATGVDNAEATKEAEQGDSDVNLELEKLKKQISDRDKKIAEIIQKEKEREEELKAKDLASKSAEERLAIYEKENQEFKRKEAFTQAFKEVGLVPEEWLSVFDNSDFSAQAKAISDLVGNHASKVAEQKLEAFKLEQLSKTDKGTVPKQEQTEDDPFLKGFKKGVNY